MKLHSLIGLAGLLLSVGAHAEEPLPLLSNVPSEAGSDDQRGSLSADCERVSAQRIRCHFVQVTVSTPTDKSIETEKQAIRATLPKRVAENPSKVWGDVCKDVDSNASYAPSEMPDMMARMKVICSERNVEGLVALLTQWQDVHERFVCRTDANQFSMTFDRVDANTWKHTNPSSGICNLQVTAFLYRDPGEPLFWNYKQVRTGAPNATSPFCRQFSGTVTMGNRWDAAREVPLRCNTLKK